MKTKAVVSLSGSEEMEAVIERVLERMLANRGGQNLSATSLADELSTLYSKITVPDNNIITDGKKVELDGVIMDQLTELSMNSTPLLIQKIKDIIYMDLSSYVCPFLGRQGNTCVVR